LKHLDATLRSGFTLIELMVVIMVLGLMSGLVAVSWERVLPGQKLSADVRALSSRLHSARSEAIARSAEFQVIYNFEQNAYWVRTPFDNEGRYQPDPELRTRVFYTKLNDGITFQEISIDGETYDASKVEIFVRFDPTGAANDHTIVLHQDKPDRVYTIEVLGLTGLIRFHDGYFEREEPRESEFQ
jgi:prepilin-type N-terminal cleavage/methylation domain-containing protein